MEKTITIDGKHINFKSTGGIMYRYKNQFAREYIADAMKLAEFTNSKQQKKVKSSDGKIVFIDDYDFTKLNLEVAYNMAWVLAKTADDSIPDPQTWLDSFDTFPIMEIVPQLNELLVVSNSSGKN